MSDFDKLLKTSAAEITNFVRNNKNTFGVLSELKVAMDRCKLNQSKRIIAEGMLPLQKELKKEVDSFDATMTRLWSKVKSKDVPPDTQKKLSDALEKGAKEVSPTGGNTSKLDSNVDNRKWISEYAFNIRGNAPN